MNKPLFLFLLVLSTSPTVAYSQWQGGGVPLSIAEGGKGPLVSISDGANGSVVVWSNYTGAPAHSDLFAQRIDATGVTLWETNGTAICALPGSQLNGTVITDGSGGFIIVWDDQRTGARDVYAQRVDAAGNILWDANGVPVCVFTGVQSGPQVVPDGSGGAILAWTDSRSGIADIYVQRIDGAGVVQWSPNGVPICTATGVQAVESILLTDTGDAVVVWYDRRNNSEDDIYAQRVNPAGSVDWASGGVAICTAAGIQRNPAIVSDGADGAIIAWDDRRGTDRDVYVQRINASGVVEWTPDGVAICTATDSQYNVDAVSDGSGGAIVAWTDFRGQGHIFAQHIDGSGSILWVVDGVRVSGEFGIALDCKVVTDGAGGAIVSWADASELYDVYAQRVDGTGAVQWTSDGVAVANKPWDEMDAVLAPSGSGGAIVSWISWVGVECVYAQQIAPDGVPSTVPRLARAATLAISEARPNPFSGATSFDLGLAYESDVVVEVFDVAGRRIKWERFEQQQAGMREMRFDGRDDAGRALPSGVYFYRVKAAGETITRKMVIAR